jgi:molybdate transport system substrate-binding protein
MTRSLKTIVLAAGLLGSTCAMADEIRVMSGGAPKELFAHLTPKFEQQTGHKVQFNYVLIPALREKVAAGEKTDVLVMPVSALKDFAKDGKVRADTLAPFGTVSISVIVKEGAAKPDISTVDKFREAMLAARSVVHATPGKTPSGIHMGKVLDQLGITDAIAKKVVHKPALEGGAELVANGQAEIGIYPASEVVEVKGVTIVGPLPKGIDLTILYGGAAMTGTSQAATDFVKFMSAPENRAAWRHAGFEPPGD